MRFNSLASAAAIAVAVAGLAGFSGVANAESNFVTGANPSTSARLDFEINIPSVLFLQVGTGSFPANVGTIDVIDFNVTPAQLAAPGTPVGGTGGNLGGGAVTVRVFGNNGTIDLISSTTGPLNNGVAGDVISWNQISVAAAPVTGPVIAHPAFVDGGNSAVVSLGPTAGRVTNLQSNWTFTYLNSTAAAPGLYEGQVTYTATMP